jgi:hydroxymethylglutaryl-CoA lyase
VLKSVELVEVAPRDGLQNEARTLSIDTRIELISKLIRAGCGRIETVSFVHPKRVPQMAGAEEVMAGLPLRDGVSYIGLVLNAKGAERALETKVQELNVVIPVTEEFSQRNQGASRAQMLEHARASIAIGKGAGRRVSVTLAVAFGCPFQGEVTHAEIRQVLDPVMDLNIDEIAFADTIGVGVPGQVRALAALAKPKLEGRQLRFHFHNTRNTGYANALAATELTDFDKVVLDASVGGFGGCPFAPKATGNIATEDLAYALGRELLWRESEGTPWEDQHVDWSGLGVDTNQLCDIAEWLSEELTSPIQSMLPRTR